MIRKRGLTVVNEHAIYNAIHKHIMVASCIAFRRTFSSVEIYLQLVAGVLSHALILVYIMNIPGTLVPLLEGLYIKKSFFRRTRDPLPKENYIPQLAFSILYFH